jgi:hypothetical protein
LRRLAGNDGSSVAALHSVAVLRQDNGLTALIVEARTSEWTPAGTKLVAATHIQFCESAPDVGPGLTVARRIDAVSLQRISAVLKGAVQTEPAPRGQSPTPRHGAATRSCPRRR